MDPNDGSERLIAARRLRLVQTALFDAMGELGETYASPPMFSHKKHGIVLGDGSVVTDHQHFDWGSVADRRTRLWTRVNRLRRLRDRETERLKAAGGSWVDIYTLPDMTQKRPSGNHDARMD